MNVFDTDFGDPKGHFLVLAILAILQDGDEIKDVNGYVSSLNLTKELQEKAGYTEKQISSAVKRWLNKKLVEEARGITIEESSLMDKSGTLPSSVRITSAGAYHLVKWSCSFSYMEAVSINVYPISRALMIARSASFPYMSYTPSCYDYFFSIII